MAPTLICLAVTPGVASAAPARAGASVPAAIDAIPSVNNPGNTQKRRRLSIATLPITDAHDMT
jgi:hypothetical protein